MFPPDPRHLMQPQSARSIASEAAENAIGALAERLGCLFVSDMCAVDEGTAASPEERLFLDASGAIMADIKVGDQAVVCLLNHDCIKALDGSVVPQPSDPIQKGNFNQALQKIDVTLPIELGQVEVDVASLLTLAVGDVIRLPGSVDKPLTVYGLDREVLFGGHLCAMNGHVALEVVRGGTRNI